jgi:hypothetical protein
MGAPPDQIDAVIADLDLYTRREVVTLATNVNANLRENPPLGTPFDTGWASANWVPSIDEPFNGSGNLRDPTPIQVAARQKVSDAGLNSVLAWRNTDGPIFTTNNVPYIGALNAGHSPQQSQPGFVQRAVEKAIKETYSAASKKADRLRRSGAVAGGTVRSEAFNRARDRRNKG